MNSYEFQCKYCGVEYRRLSKERYIYCKRDMGMSLVVRGPVVRTLCFHCRGHRFDPWSGNSDLAQSPIKLGHEVRVVRKQGQIMEDFGAHVRT